MFLALLGLTFASCEDQNEDNPIKFDKTPAEAIDGKVYAGTWTRILDADTTVVSGSISFAAAGDEYYNSLDSANTTRGYVAVVTLASDDKSKLDFGTVNNSICNLSYSNHGYIFTCGSMSGLGAGFKGRIEEDGSADMKFKMTQKVGRKAYEYQFSFVGAELVVKE